MIDSSSSDRSRRGIFFVIAFLIVIVMTNVAIVAIQRRQTTAALPKFLQSAAPVELHSLESGSPIYRQQMAAYYLKEDRIKLLARIKSELASEGWTSYNSHIRDVRSDIAVFQRLNNASSKSPAPYAQYMICGSGPIDEQGGFLNPENKTGPGTTVILTDSEPLYALSMVCVACRVDMTPTALKRTRLIHTPPKPPTPIVKTAP
jgi:hypothetical protein